MVQTRYIFNIGSNLGIDDDFQKEKRESKRERERERCIRQENPLKPKKNDKEKSPIIL